MSLLKNGQIYCILQKKYCIEFRYLFLNCFNAIRVEFSFPTFSKIFLILQVLLQFKFPTLLQDEESHNKFFSLSRQGMQHSRVRRTSLPAKLKNVVSFDNYDYCIILSTVVSCPMNFFNTQKNIFPCMSSTYIHAGFYCSPTRVNNASSLHKTARIINFPLTPFT